MGLLGPMFSNIGRFHWRHGLMGVVAVLIVVLAWRYWVARWPEEVVLRPELELREGQLYRPGGSEPFFGLLVENWRPNQRRVEVTIRDGRADGLSRFWYENGQMEVKEHFVRGVSNGQRTRWYADGGKKSEVLIKEGQLVGVFREWHANGQLARETPLSGGVADGEVKSWDELGKALRSTRVKNGRKTDS